MAANARYFFSLLAGIVEFDIVPADWLETDVFSFKEEVPLNHNFEMMDIF